AVRHHDLPVDHAPLRQLPDDLADKLGKVPRHRALVAAADLHLVTVAEDDGPEPVPFRLVAVAAVGYRLDRLGEHRRDRRADPKPHRRILPASNPWSSSRTPTPRECPVPLHTDARRSGESAEFDINPLYVRLAQAPVPRHSLPREPMLPGTAAQVVRDELLLDGNARLNLATFVTTWMEPEAQVLMTE